MDLIEEIKKRGGLVEGSIQNLMPIGHPDELYRACLLYTSPSPRDRS